MTGRSKIALARIRELRGDRSPRAARVRQVEARVAALDPDPEVQAALRELAVGGAVSDPATLVIFARIDDDTDTADQQPVASDVPVVPALARYLDGY